MPVGPQTLIEFQEMFPDEAACWAHLRAVRWPEGFDSLEPATPRSLVQRLREAKPIYPFIERREPS